MESHPSSVNLVASGGHDGIIFIWDLIVGGPQPRLTTARLITKDTPPPPSSNSPPRSYKDVDNWVRKISWNDSGKYLTAGFCGGKVAVWSTD